MKLPVKQNQPVQLELFEKLEQQIKQSPSPIDTRKK